MAAGKRVVAVKANVSPEQREALRAFAYERGIKMSTLIQAIAEWLRLGKVPHLDDPEFIADAQRMQWDHDHVPRPRKRKTT